MRYLLDTHAIIWYFENSPQLPQTMKELIKSPENDIYVCSVSLWEIAIKINLGKLKLSITFDELVRDVKRSDFSVLQIEDEHLLKLSELPFIHKDPFDRMIISAALAESLTIITIDENIKKYGAHWTW